MRRPHAHLQLRLHRPVLAVLAALWAGSALAVPSFSRQVNQSCSACHTNFPQLTDFGRAFKAAGYTLNAEEQVSEARKGRDALELSRFAPLSAQIIASYTKVRSPGGGVRSGDVVLPDQLSLFYAGQVAPDFGAFAQLTYSSDADHFSMDNLDLRYAHQLKLGGRPLIVGATINNNPTVQDLWNTTPAWGWPFVTSGPWPGTGSNAALVDGQLAGAVAGVTAYGFLDETLYGEVGMYRSAPLGVGRPFTQATPNLIDNVAPYWRVALQHEFGGHHLELGAFGLFAKVKPGFGGTPAVPPPGGAGASDTYSDVAVDGEWQHGGAVATTLRGVWIHERRTLDASAPGERPSLDTIRVSGDAYWDWVGVGVGVFHTGSSDSAAFGEGGSAATTGVLGELIFRPWDNTNLRAQYTHYAKLDGTGSGASASDALSLVAWLAF